MKNWWTLIISLPTENATLRQRAWRTLKASGAVVLRDGVYLMPHREPCRAILEQLAHDVIEGGGMAMVLRTEEPTDAHFETLFDRTPEFTALMSEVTHTMQKLGSTNTQEVLKAARKHRKAFAGIADIDFFPGEAQKQTETALCELERALARALSPDEPQAIQSDIAVLEIGQYQGRTWATRRRPWVDRLASAWLIHRFIDAQAQILWLDSPADCPKDALGFDFDGAAFTHVGNRVTFEVLAASFGLSQAAVTRLGLIVHCLDVGGVQPIEAAGIESVLTGMRESITDDNLLLQAASAVFDGLLANFEKTRTSP